MKKLEESDLISAIHNGEFDRTIIAASRAVAIVLTQSWCPQWHAMRAYLRQPEFSERDDLTIFYTEYDLCKPFDEFRAHKERHWQNDQVPYVRYYHNGELTGSSNYLSVMGFIDNLQESPK